MTWGEGFRCREGRREHSQILRDLLLAVILVTPSGQLVPQALSSAQTCLASGMTGWTSLGFVDKGDQEDLPWFSKKKAQV